MSGRRTTALKAAQKAEALKSTDSKRATPRISFKNETWYQKIYSSLSAVKNRELPR